MKTANRLISRRNSTATWSSLDPEERNILTASQLNAQNQKVRKDLEVINKGIEDEKRCEKVARAKEEIMLQDRLSRLSKASEKLARRASMICTENVLRSFLQDSSKDRELRARASEPIHRAEKDDRTTQSKLRIWKSSMNNLSHSPLSRSSPQPSWSCLDKRKVRFGSNSASLDELKDRGLNSRESFAQRSFINSPRSILGSSHHVNRSSDESLISEDGGQSKLSKFPTSMDYYHQPLIAKIVCPPSKGFSHNSASFGNLTAQRNSLNQLAGLKDEMQRWRRLSTTRAMNARLKAVRPMGRRYNSNMSLKDAMDLNARLRKDMAFRNEEFTPDAAWRLLNCRYLRLTPNNIKTLENVCGEAGYDISAHPHVNHDVDVTFKIEAEPEFGNYVMMRK